MLRKFGILALLPLALSACASSVPAPRYFLVLRDVPTTPSFVVIPFNGYLEQVEYANEVEESLIKAGAAVQQRPHVRDVIDEKQLGAGSAAATNDGVDAQLANRKTTEAYSVYENLTADYIVYTEKNERRIRVARRESNELVAVFKLHAFQIKADDMMSELVQKLSAGNAK